MGGGGCRDYPEQLRGALPEHGAVVLCVAGYALARFLHSLDAQANRDWCVAIYETPAGARLFPPNQRMCRLQKCFRARVSPKPWRANVVRRFRAGGIWPVRDPYKLAAREQWVRQYDKQADRYASCRIAGTVGNGRPDPRVEEIRRLHDELCRADSRLDLA